MEILGALLSGVLIGSVLGFVGAGGAMLSVPILIYLFNFTAPNATTAALAIVIAAATSGLIPKFKSKDVLVKEAIIISAISTVANVGFSLNIESFSDEFIKSGFALVLIIAATSMLIKPVVGSEKKVPLLWLLLISLVIGTMTGLFGIGGGFLAIPILVLFFKTSAVKAAGTSLLIIVLNSIIAFLAHYAIWDKVNWKLPIIMALSAVVIARLAAIKASSVNPLMLKRAFAYLLFAISAFTLVQTWIISS
jgi:uncharacterized membrane protein YfcA